MLTGELVRMKYGGAISLDMGQAVQKEKPKNWPRGVRISEMGGCERKQTLRLAGYRGEYPTPFDEKNFAAGNAWEDVIAALWAKEYPKEARRWIPVPTPYGTGEIDLYIPPENLIVECKTTTEQRASYLPNRENVTYVLKDTGEVLSFVVKYDPTLCEKLEVKMADIHRNSLAREVLPIPQGYRDDKFPCHWGHGSCAYYKYCWEEETAVEPRHTNLGRALRDS
jgi:hypothetical protein